MKQEDFTTTCIVDQSPLDAFKAITNVRSWWSEEIDGKTEKLNDEFAYHYRDVHRCKIKVVESVPGQKVIWLVEDNYFNFIQDQREWIGTKIIFDISREHDKTHIRFTHQGLVPAYECYDICKNAWTQYIQESLWSLITTGKGQPNPIEAVVNAASAKAKSLKREDYTTAITVNATAQEAFDSINRVTLWWTENLKGSSAKLNDEFTVQFGDVHISTQKLIEVIPGKKVVWLVTYSKLNFIKDKHEWTGSKIIFDISEKDAKTQVRFTHHGLSPDIECFSACSNAWSEYIQHSLKALINTGKGQPTIKED